MAPLAALRAGAAGLMRAAELIAVAANAVGTLVVLGLVLVVNVDVVARGVFNAPFLGRGRSRPVLDGADRVPAAAGRGAG